jgi:hypothetical protein
MRPSPDTAAVVARRCGSRPQRCDQPASLTWPSPRLRTPPRQPRTPNPRRTPVRSMPLLARLSPSWSKCPALAPRGCQYAPLTSDCSIVPPGAAPLPLFPFCRNFSPHRSWTSRRFVLRLHVRVPWPWVWGSGPSFCLSAICMAAQSPAAPIISHARESLSYRSRLWYTFQLRRGVRGRFNFDIPLSFKVTTVTTSPPSYERTLPERTLAQAAVQRAADAQVSPCSRSAAAPSAVLHPGWPAPWRCRRARGPGCWPLARRRGLATTPPPLACPAAPGGGTRG